DAELDGQPTANADGDDINGIDDEDGVVFTCPLYRGHQGAVIVTNSVPGYLNTWIDFNGDGSWVQADEHIYNDLYLNYAGNHPLTFSIPPGAGLGTTYARFRFSTVTGLSYDGLTDDGEVEDYKVIIEETELQTKMHFIQWPDTTNYGMDIYNLDPFMLADDFLCTETGIITEIHVWCSWKFDELPINPPLFIIHFWSNDTEGPYGYSQPDTLIHSIWMDSGTYEYFPYKEGLFEWWYNYSPFELIPGGDTIIWEYVFNINDSLAFFQEEGNIYWISLQTVLIEPGTEEFGWKTSVNQWNDDAVWVNWDRTLLWNELIYPDGHPLHPYSLDLAFYLYGRLSTPVDITITVYEDSNFVKIEWTTVPGAISYKVYSST
ncbi:MAG: hypothetical protein KAT74_02780, partial [Candidatus Cloacimonetes bacterium]|nr:hypothetical protein [Candidatus Cloacimonadota bacterium]